MNQALETIPVSVHTLDKIKGTALASIFTEELFQRLNMNGFTDSVTVIAGTHTEYILDAGKNYNWDLKHSSAGFAFPLNTLEGTGYIGVFVQNTVYIISRIQARNFVAKYGSFILEKDYAVISLDCFKDIKQMAGMQPLNSQTPDKIIYDEAGNEFTDNLSSALKPNPVPVDEDLLTLTDLKQTPPHTIIAHGMTTIEHPWFNDPTVTNMESDGRSVKVRWVAIRGEIEDWAIYHSLDGNFGDIMTGRDHVHISLEDITSLGAKLHNRAKVRELVPCTDEALDMYRD